MTFQFPRFLRDASSEVDIYEGRCHFVGEFGLGCGSFCFLFNSPVGRRYFPKKGFARQGFRHRVLSSDLVSESTVIEQPLFAGMVCHFLFHGNPYFLICTSDSAIQKGTAFQDIVRATGGVTPTTHV